jgi:hypothetical protein
VRERIFLQRLPEQQIAVVIFEGPHLAASFVAFSGQRDAMTRWLLEQVREVHGFDLDHPPRFTVAEPAFDSEP